MGIILGVLIFILGGSFGCILGGSLWHYVISPIFDIVKEMVENWTVFIKTIIKDTGLILSLLSDCIYLHHPIIVCIRWTFHIELSKIMGIEPHTKEIWNNTVKKYDYNLRYFAFAFIKNARFRKSIIDVLTSERDKLSDE